MAVYSENYTITKNCRKDAMWTILRNV